MSSVVFLDIDGPVIPDFMFVLDEDASMHRKVFSTFSLALVQCLCLNANAKLVTNSSHNYWYTDKITDKNRNTEPVQDLKYDLCVAGLHPSIFHDDWCTEYGMYHNSGVTRMGAINNWLAEHPDVDNWVCFDDIEFTDDERLIVVNESIGITYGDYAAAAHKLGLNRPFVINTDLAKKAPKLKTDSIFEYDGDHTHDDRIL